MHKIALVEDDQSLGYILKEYLQLNNYAVSWKQTASEALNEIISVPFDLIIIDVNLPDFDGFELAEKLNEAGNRVPFIFLTARRLKVDKLKGFKLGSEDFIVKPVDEEELLARMTVILRRPMTNSTIAPHSTLTIGSIKFLPDSLQLEVEGNQVNLTEMESDLLKMLCVKKNQLVNRKDIMLKIWNEDSYFTRRSMDVFISRLRKLLVNEPGVSIKTVHGKGYVLTEE